MQFPIYSHAIVASWDMSAAARTDLRWLICQVSHPGHIRWNPNKAQPGLSLTAPWFELWWRNTYNQVLSWLYLCLWKMIHERHTCKHAKRGEDAGVPAISGKLKLMIRYSRQIHLSSSDIVVLWLVGGCKEDLFAVHYETPLVITNNNTQLALGVLRRK